MVDLLMFWGWVSQYIIYVATYMDRKWADKDISKKDRNAFFESSEQGEQDGDDQPMVQLMHFKMVYCVC